MTTIDEELSQSRARVVITGICLLAFSVVGINRGLGSSDHLVQGLVVISLYLLFAVAWYTMVYRLPGKYPLRRYVTILADLGIMTYWLHYGDKHVASYYPIFLWIIIGNGIRFGEKHLKVAIVTGAVGFGSLLVFNEFWKAHMEIAAGLLLGVLVLPVFFLSVLRRLRTMSQLQIALAKSRLADKAKDQFLATMSHEIRTPMNGVLGMAETLRATDLNEDQQERSPTQQSKREAVVSAGNSTDVCAHQSRDEARRQQDAGDDRNPVHRDASCLRFETREFILDDRGVLTDPVEVLDRVIDPFDELAQSLVLLRGLPAHIFDTEPGEGVTLRREVAAQTDRPPPDR